MPAPIINKFSVNDTNPRGTLLSPPTQAHLSSRLSTYTALYTEMAPTEPINNDTGPTIKPDKPAIMPMPANASASWLISRK